MATNPAKRNNLSTIAFRDMTAGKWSSMTTGCGTYRKIYHYGTLMMIVKLDTYGSPIRSKTNPWAAIVDEFAGWGSMSDKCGLSRIRSSLLRWNNSNG